jgi:hypothetical protein
MTMSETKLTRYDWGKEGVVVNPNGDYYDKGDADARIAALERDLQWWKEYGNSKTQGLALANAQVDAAERERDELRKRVEDLEPLKRRLCDAIPLLEEARDALPAISESSRILHRISPSLADRMDEVGNIDLWKKMDALRTPPAAQGAQP